MTDISNAKPKPVFLPESHPSFAQSLSLGAQHVLAMFGATVLAPILMGFDPNTAILFSGVATIIFYGVVRGKVPSYLGSSFAFIAAVAAASGYSGTGPNPNIGIALGGIFFAGLIYGLIGLFVMWRGHKLIERIFPDLVSGTVVGIIGISLAGVAVSQVGKEPFAIVVAGLTLLTASLWSVYLQGKIGSLRPDGKPNFLTIFEMIPIIAAGVLGYLVYHIGTSVWNLGKPVDFSSIANAPWIGLPSFTSPVFNIAAILTIAPVVIVLLAENLGHVKAIGAMIGRPLDDQVGRAYLGDAIGTMTSSMFGGTGVTTYAENMAVMRLSNNFSSITFVMAGGLAILLGFSPKFGAVIQSIPPAVLGGLSLAMFGLITAAAGSIWQRGIQAGSINFLETRTLLVAGTGLVLGAGNLSFKIAGAEVSGIVTATIVTIVLFHLLHRTPSPSQI